MKVDQVRPGALNQSAQFPQGKRIHKRIDCAPQVRDNVDGNAAPLARIGQKATLPSCHRNLILLTDALSQGQDMSLGPATLCARDYLKDLRFAYPMNVLHFSMPRLGSESRRIGGCYLGFVYLAASAMVKESIPYCAR